MKKKDLLIFAVLIFAIFSVLIFKLSLNDKKTNQETKIDQVLDINISKALQEPQEFENVSISYDTTGDELFSEVCLEEHLSFVEKVSMLIPTCHQAGWDSSYAIVKQTVQMTENDQYVLCFYVSLENDSFDHMTSVIGAYVDGEGKAFSGELFYILESENKLFWRINGDFYNAGRYLALENTKSIVGVGGRVNYKAIGALHQYSYQSLSGSLYSFSE